MLINKLDLIEGIIHMVFADSIPKRKYKKMILRLSKESNFVLAESYYKSTGKRLRPIMHDIFIDD